MMRLRGPGCVFLYWGTRFEERDLVGDFGEPYQEYQRRIPMLLPRSLHPGPSEG